MSTSPLKADSRAQFEKWFKERFHLGDEHLSQGDYGSDTAQTAWMAWQASRAAIVVDLPSLKQSETGDRYQWSDGVFHFKHDTADILRAAGITVKGDS